MVILRARQNDRPMDQNNTGVNHYQRPPTNVGVGLKNVRVDALLTRRVSQENPPCPAGPVKDRAPSGSFPGTLIGGTGGDPLARSGPNSPRTRLILRKSDSPLRGKSLSGNRDKI